MLAGDMRSVLELGSFLGYSATNFIETLDHLGGGTFVGVDHDEELLRQAVTNVSQLNTNVDYTFVVGDANLACLDLRRRKEYFDLILLDIDETSYLQLFSSCLDILKPGGLLVVDNVLMSTVDGWVDGNNVIENRSTPVLSCLHELLTTAFADDRVWSSVVPLGSGLLLCGRRRSSNE